MKRSVLFVGLYCMLIVGCYSLQVIPAQKSQYANIMHMYKEISYKSTKSSFNQLKRMIIVFLKKHPKLKGEKRAELYHSLSWLELRALKYFNWVHYGITPNSFEKSKRFCKMYLSVIKACFYEKKALNQCKNIKCKRIKIFRVSKKRAYFQKQDIEKKFSKDIKQCKSKDTSQNI